MKMLKIEDKATLKKIITEKDIVEFSKVSGDTNPIHLNEEYAKNSIFGKRIAHGMLSASFISNVIGNQLPGQGTIYLKQSLKFCKPVYIDDIITVTVEVKEIDYDKSIILLDTKCTSQNGDIVIEGEAYVKNKNALTK